MASPFIGKTFTFTQPDGTTIQLRGWGDQHYAVFETLDGYTRRYAERKLLSMWGVKDSSSRPDFCGSAAEKGLSCLNEASGLAGLHRYDRPARETRQSAVGGESEDGDGGRIIKHHRHAHADGVVELGRRVEAMLQRVRRDWHDRDVGAARRLGDLRRRQRSGPSPPGGRLRSGLRASWCRRR